VESVMQANTASLPAIMQRLVAMNKKKRFQIICKNVITSLRRVLIYTRVAAIQRLQTLKAVGCLVPARVGTTTLFHYFH
jgi:hypothetical protein